MRCPRNCGKTASRWDEAAGGSRAWARRLLPRGEQCQRSRAGAPRLGVGSGRLHSEAERQDRARGWGGHHHPARLEHLSTLDGTARQKIRKDEEELNTINQQVLRNIFRTFYATTEYTLFSRAHRTYSKID